MELLKIIARFILKEPPPIKPAGTIPIDLASSILLDKLEEMGCEDAGIYLPDVDMKVYNKDKVAKCYALQEVSSLTFVAETHDCDDFAAKLFGRFAGLVWTNIHALNWFIDENEILWFIEPQTKKISREIEAWQGNAVRFFLGR